jgi:amino acid permease
VNGWSAFSENMQGLAAIIFCYVNHQLVFPLVYDLKNPTKKRLDKVFYRVHTTEIIIYLTVGLCGYLLLSEHADKFPINSVVMGSIMTSTMTLGKIFMVVALFFAIPLSLFPAR